MDVLVAYDVNTTDADGPRRLRRVHTVCKNYGQRVQFSLFECRVNEAQLERLEADLLAELDLDRDSLRIYTLPTSGRGLRAHGVDRYLDFDDPLIL